MPYKLKELRVNEEGQLTLEGKVIDARFVGRGPVMVTAETLEDEISRRRTIHDRGEIDKVGEHMKANAYLKGDVCGESPSLRSTTAVQYFRIV